MAPEVLKQNEYREKADIWSLGVLLYEMLHGYAPFQGKKEQETIKKIMEEKLVFNSDIQSDTKRLVKALLKENPLHRPCIQEIFDMNWIKRMQTEFKMDDRMERKMNTTFDDLNRSGSTERVKSSVQSNLAKKLSPRKKELKIAVKEISKVSSQPQVLEEKKSLVNVVKNVKSPIRKPYQQVKEQSINKDEQELSYEEVFGIAKRCDRLLRGERSELSPARVDVKDTIDTNIKEDIDALIENSKPDVIEQVNDIETNTQPLTEEHDEISVNLNKELSIIDEKQKGLLQVEDEEDATNASFNSDDYASKRSNSLLMTINYLDGLDCGLELEDLDQYVRQIEEENQALKKLYANTPEPKPLNIPITTPMQEISYNDKAEYKKSMNDIIDSLISIKSHKVKQEIGRASCRERVWS
jgi:rRNA processing protein Gar1